LFRVSGEDGSYQGWRGYHSFKEGSRFVGLKWGVGGIGKMRIKRKLLSTKTLEGEKNDGSGGLVLKK